MMKTQKKMSRRREILKDKELRQEFLGEQIKVGLRFQLRSLRDSQGLTQGDLAEMIGTQQSVISRLERNPSRVSLPTLIDLANAFDVGVVVRFEQIDSIIDWYDNPTTIKMTPAKSEDVLNAPDAIVAVTEPELPANEGTTDSPLAENVEFTPDFRGVFRDFDETEWWKEKQIIPLPHADVPENESAYKKLEHVKSIESVGTWL